MQHPIDPDRGAAFARLGVERLDQRTQRRPRHHPLHLGQKRGPPRRLGVAFKTHRRQRQLLHPPTQCSNPPRQTLYYNCSRLLQRFPREQVASHPVFLDKMTATLTSNVIGCEVKLTTPNNLQAIFLAETLLAALEALLATSMNERVHPYRSTLEIRMRPALFDIGEPTITRRGRQQRRGRDHSSPGFTLCGG